MATAWFTVDGKPVVTEYFVRQEDGDVAIASEITNLTDGTPSEANALLIAAAPDMYLALENLLPTLTARYGSITEQNLLFDVRYALAKARGETP